MRRFPLNKRPGGLFAALALSALLCACGGASDTVTILREWEPASAADANIKTPAGDTAGVRIGMITDVGGIDDDSFNQSAWEGLQELARVTGCTVDYIESNSTEEFAANFETMAESGYQLVWGVGYACADAMLEAAERYPGVHFAVVDSEYAETPENVTGVMFRAEEASFLVGYIAASASQTGALGFVGGIESATIDQFQYGYQAGVAYADRWLQRSTEVLVRYADSFSDPIRGKELTEELIGLGCDVIYHAAGGTGTGVIEAARDGDVFAIGVDRDQSYLAPEHVLTSALKKVNAAVLRVSRDYIEGREIGGSTFYFGLAEGAVGIPKEGPNFSDELYDAALRVEDDIIAGKLAPPATREAYEAFLRENLSGET